MNYTQAQIEKLLIEREWSHRSGAFAETVERDTELDEVWKTQERGIIDAAKSVYQEAT